jgi:predicted DNA binding CopG/RHH family protein
MTIDGENLSEAMTSNVPDFNSDAEAEAFLEQDLSDIDFSQLKPPPFEFERNAGQLNMRLSRRSPTGQEIPKE